MRPPIALAGIKFAANTIIGCIPMIAGVAASTRSRRAVEVDMFGGSGDPMDMSRRNRAARTLATRLTWDNPWGDDN